MDIQTGKIYEFENEDELQKALLNNSNLVQVNPEDMTEKQREEMQVSLDDRESKLGKFRHDMQIKIKNGNKRKSSRRKKN